jgi:putative chitinase
MATVTLDILQRIAPSTKAEKLEGFVEGLQTACDRFEINTISRLSCFLAQVGHESGGFNAVKENLNYGAKGLRGTFPKYFPTDELALAYERQPEKIANRVYANRMGNGPEESGDGFTYRGRGLIQLTGCNNYTAFATDMGMTMEEAIDYLETYEGAAMSAAWFWWKNNLNQWADQEDMLNLTKRINGGTIGLQDRIHHFELAKGAFETQI